MTDDREMRAVYCDKLIELAKKDRNIMAIEADLMKASGTTRFFQAYPEQSIDVGIAEANMIGVAAGLTTYGKIPFCSSFATFATRRCYDQIFISVAYSKRNVKIVGTDPGISAELNGGTHMPFEDMAIMRAVPDMICIEPTDEAMLDAIMEQVAYVNKPVYLRLFRKKCEKVFNLGDKFDIFKAKEIKEGRDATIICSGIMVDKAIKAEEILREKGYDVAILNTFTWKPIDKDAVLAAAKKTGAIVVAENHNIVNGLAAAVAEVVMEDCPVPIGRIGAKDTFGEVGKMSYLEQRFEMSAQHIADKVIEVINKKK